MKRCVFVLIVPFILVATSLLASNPNALQLVVEYKDSVVAPRVDGLIILRVIAPEGHDREIEVDALFSEYSNLSINCPQPKPGQDPRVYIHIKADTLDVGRHSIRLYILQDLSDYAEYYTDFEVKNLITTKNEDSEQPSAAFVANPHYRVILTQSDGWLKENKNGLWRYIQTPCRATQSNVAVGDKDLWIVDSSMLYHYHEQQQSWTSRTWSSINVIPQSVRHMDCDPSGKLCLLMNNGAWARVSDSEADYYPVVDSNARRVLADNEGNYWFASPLYLSCWTNGLLKRFQLDTAFPESNRVDITELCMDARARVWVSTSNKNRSQKFVAGYVLEQDSIRTVFWRDFGQRLDSREDAFVRLIPTSDSSMFYWAQDNDGMDDQPKVILTEITFCETLKHRFYDLLLRKVRFISQQSDRNGNIWLYNSASGAMSLFNKHGIQTEGSTQVSDTQYESRASCSPNPSTTTITFHFPEQTQASVIVVRDVLGRVYTQCAVQASGEIQFDVQTWPAGSYVASIGTYCIPFVVLH